MLQDGGFSDEEAFDWLFRADDSLPGTPVQALRDDRHTEVTRRAQALALLAGAAMGHLTYLASAGRVPGRHRAAGAGAAGAGLRPLAAAAARACCPSSSSSSPGCSTRSRRGTGTTAPTCTLGVRLPGGIPVEEVLFFLVVPLCAVLAFEAVRKVTGWDAGYPGGATR